MDFSAKAPTTGTETPLSRWLRREGAPLALLIVCAALLHAWVIGHTEVAARDSIAFIRYAWQLDHEPVAQVLKNSLHPPLYPLTVLGVSHVLRGLSPMPDVPLMQTSAQIASTLAGLLLILPMYFLGKELFDRRVGFASALLFQCLPVGSRALSDGLTEGLFLLLIATGLFLALPAFRRGSPLLFGGIGLCGGLAYLTRPEGAMLVLATVLVLLTCRTITRRWCLASLTGAALLVSVPYMLTIGGITNKTTGNWLIQPFTPSAHAAEPAGLSTMQVPAATTPVAFPIVFAASMDDWKEYHHTGKLSWGILALLQETSKSFHYVAWFPALLGLWWFRSRCREMPGIRVMLLVSVLHILLLLRVTVVAGYVSERHTLLLVLCGCPWAIAGIRELPRRMTALGERLYFPSRMTSWWGHAWGVEKALVALLIVAGLPSSAKTLHSNRAGHRAAGTWLAANTHPWDAIFDPFCWAHFYAGRVFCEGMEVQVPAGATRLQYVVMDTATAHSRIPQLLAAIQLIRTGRIKFEWPDPATGKPSTVQVYEVPVAPQNDQEMATGQE